MRASRRIPLACALIALIAAAVVLLPTLEQGKGSPSLLVRMSFAEPMSRYARVADHDFRFVTPDGHYDGVYFYAIAMDPLLLGEQHTIVTQPAYRYRGPLYGWLAGAVSLGQAPLIPWGLLLVNLAMIAAASALVSVLAMRLGASPWLGLLVALNPGFLLALTVDTAEPTAMALIAAGMVAWLAGRRWTAGVLLVAAALSREIGALVAAGMILAELAAWWRLRADRPPLRAWIRRVSPLALAPVLYLGWWAYLYVQVGAWPTFEPSNLGLPLMATWETIVHAAQMGVERTMDRIQLGVGMVAVLGAALMTLVIAFLRALRLRTIVDGAIVAAAPLVLALNWLPMLYPKEMLRNTAVLGVLVILSFAARPLVARRSGDTGAPPTPDLEATWAGSGS